MLTPTKLKYLRLLHGLTQSELAKKIPSTKNYISEIENEKVKYSEEQCLKIVNAIYLAHADKKSKENVTEILEDVTEVVKNMKK